MPHVLNAEEIATAQRSSPDWRLEGQSLVREVQADSFAGGIRLVAAVADAADAMNHHPDIDIRFTSITFRLTTHSEGGITDNDVRLATEIDRIAAEPS